MKNAKDDHCLAEVPWLTAEEERRRQLEVEWRKRRRATNKKLARRVAEVDVTPELVERYRGEIRRLEDAFANSDYPGARQCFTDLFSMIGSAREQCRCVEAIAVIDYLRPWSFSRLRSRLSLLFN